VNQTKRDYFDEQVAWVLERLPKNVLRILLEVPLHVEDQPSKHLCQELELDDPEELCGCFTGVAYGEGSALSTNVSLPNSITIFRRGIIAESRDENGKIRRSSLRHQIRVTILHELAHLHGMDEEEIGCLGYG